MSVPYGLVYQLTWMMSTELQCSLSFRLKTQRQFLEKSLIFTHDFL